MELAEFGKENRRKIVLLPGNMMSWRQFESVISLLARDHHLIAVSTDSTAEQSKKLVLGS